MPEFLRRSGACLDPQDYPENVLDRPLCSHTLPPCAAQEAMAGDWVAAYRRRS